MYIIIIIILIIIIIIIFIDYYVIDIINILSCIHLYIRIYSTYIFTIYIYSQLSVSRTIDKSDTFSFWLDFYLVPS